jgi:signal transduction histidine kinase
MNLRDIVQAVATVSNGRRGVRYGELHANTWEVDGQTTEQCLADATVDRSPAHDDSRRKDTFVATVAHELRQPLSAMLAAVEVVRRGAGTESARRAADVMRRQLSLMSRQVEDLVDAVRWARGKVSLHKCRLDLRDVMRDAAADVEATIAEGRPQLLVAGEQEPIWVEGDRQRLLQVVSNLLRNAVSYSQPGGRITMAVERMASTVTLRVGDTGRGIEAEALPYVFELFSQMRPHEGTGLGIGLSVVREIVLLHGGSIEARSDGAGKGCEFLVRLPLARIPKSFPVSHSESPTLTCDFQ